MKIYIKILCFAIVGLFLIMPNFSSAAGMVEIPGWSTKEIRDVTINRTASWNIVDNINAVWFSLLKKFKIILQWLMLIYVVYIWITMVISMGTDEEKLSKSKRQLWYMFIALVFINIPWTIYSALRTDSRNIGTWTWWENFGKTDWKQNIFVNMEPFVKVVKNIVVFMEYIIAWLAVFVVILAGINILISRWRDEKVTEAKNKILYGMFALLFVWFIEAWKQLAITGELSYWNGIFESITGIALLFAAPVAMIFLTFAGYYYITSNGDDEKVKKAKAIVINTMIAMALLLVMVTFLNDLLTLNVT